MTDETEGHEQGGGQPQEQAQGQRPEQTQREGQAQGPEQGRGQEQAEGQAQEQEGRGQEQGEGSKQAQGQGQAQAVGHGQGGGPALSGGQGQPEQGVGLTQQVLNRIADALELLDWAIANGSKSDDDDPSTPSKSIELSDETIKSIKEVAAKAGVDGWKRDGTGKNFRQASNKESPEHPSIMLSEWLAFERAYHNLSNATSPVTAETLADTETTSRWFVPNTSPAQFFTRFLGLIGLFFAAFVVLGDWGLVRYGPVQDGEVDRANTLLQWYRTLIPYAYGGVGSCVYLLRKAHTFIHRRCFDVRRKPEYTNRIVLGMIAGGAITLFVNQITGDDGTVIRLSAAALGFLAGYSTDFLYSTIERIIAAILPRVGIQSVQRATSTYSFDISAGGMTLEQLIAKYEGTTNPADKALYKSLIDKIQSRM